MAKPVIVEMEIKPRDILQLRKGSYSRCDAGSIPARMTQRTAL